MTRLALLFFIGCGLAHAKSMEQEAIQFLKLWLVDGAVEKALRYVSTAGPLCVPPLDTGRAELAPATPREARERLREAMTAVLKAIGTHSSLGLVIGPLPPALDFVGKPAARGRPFNVWDAPDATLRALTCDAVSKRTRGVVVFVFRGETEDEPAGGMHLVFERFGSSWRIVAFNALRI